MKINSVLQLRETLKITFYPIHIKHLTPNLDLRSPEMIEKHAQAAIDFIMAGVTKSAGN